MTERLPREQIAQILAAHLAWLRVEPGGQRADLNGADLRRADLRGAYLSRAYLSRADLRGAYLSGADLSRAYLSRAYLSGADLSRADLRWANLSGAYLSGADLSGAYLSGADLPFRILQIGPIGSRSDYLMYRFDTATVSTGCFTGTLDEFAAAVTTTHGDSQHGSNYRAAIAMLRDIIGREPVQESVVPV